MNYFVERRLYNGESGGIDYAKPQKFDNLDEALKAYHNVLSTYINYGQLVKVSAMLYNDDNGIIEQFVWNKQEAPETI